MPNGDEFTRESIEEYRRKKKPTAVAVAEPKPARPEIPEVSEEPSIWQKVLYYASGALEKLFTPATVSGVTYREMEKQLKAVPPQKPLESARAYKERLATLGMEKPERKFIAPWQEGWLEAQGLEKEQIATYKETLPGGKLYEEYEELPWTQQLKYELPFWGALTLLPGATAARATLAPAAARPGVAAIAPKIARVALAPVEYAIERPLAIALKYGIGFPLKYGVAKPAAAGVRKAFETALDTGLDKWLLRQGLRGDQANSVVRFFLEKNKRWLYQKAEANWLKRLAEKKGTKYAATKATEDTIIEAEPLLLQAAKDSGVKAPPPTAKLPAEIKPPVRPVTPKVTKLPEAFIKATEDDILRMESQLARQRLVVEKARNAFEQVVPPEAKLKVPRTGKEELETLVDIDKVTPQMVEAVQTLRDELRIWVELNDGIVGLKKFLAEAKAYKAPAIPKAPVTPKVTGQRIFTSPSQKAATDSKTIFINKEAKFQTEADIDKFFADYKGIIVAKDLERARRIISNTREGVIAHEQGHVFSASSELRQTPFMVHLSQEIRKIWVAEETAIRAGKKIGRPPLLSFNLRKGGNLSVASEEIPQQFALYKLNPELQKKYFPEIYKLFNDNKALVGKYDLPVKEIIAIPKAEVGMPEVVKPPTPLERPVEVETPFPPEPPIPPGAELPPATPPSGRPRTLLDLNREAKGMRAMTSEQRAEAMDIARPIEEDEILWKMRPFKEHAKNLLGPDTPIKKALRTTPGWKQVARVWSPAQVERDNPIAMIGVRKAIFEEIEVGRSRTATLAWYNDMEHLFGFKKIRGEWRATKVKPSPKANPQKKLYKTIFDLVENPDHYVLTPAQEKTLRIGQNMMTRNLRDNQRVGVDVVELEGEYWRRMVIKGPKTTSIGQQIDGFFKARRAGAQKGFTRQRAFPLADDLIKAGFNIETHPLTTIQNRLESGIRTFSNMSTRQEIAKLPGVEKPLERFEGKFPETIEGQKAARKARDETKRVYLKDKTAENYNLLKQAEADYITAMREVFIKKIEVGQPGYYELRLPNGRIAPQELVEEVNKFIDLPEIRTGGGNIANNMVEVTRLVRTTLTNVDLAAGFIQGQVLFYRNNPAWWVAQSKAIVALFNDPYAYVSKNFDLMDEGMRMGAISIPTEFLFSRAGIASIPTRIPGIGIVMRSCNRAFEWFIVAGQTELYKATRKGVLGKAMGSKAGAELSEKATEDLVSLGSAIRKELGTESYAILGVRPTQTMFEQLSLFAARFLRANVGILAQATSGAAKTMTFQTPSVGEREAMKGMASLIAGGIALLVAITWAKDRKLPNMTDPFAPDWMMFSIGRTYFSTFGPFYPYFRTIARMSVYTAQGKPDKAADELARFFRGKAGIPFRAIDIAGQFAFAGKAQTFDGEVLEKTPGDIAKGVFGEMMVPISIQEALQSIPEGRYESAIAEIFGLVGRGSPYAQMDIEFQKAKDINSEGLSYRYAEAWQEKEMEKRFPDIAKMMVGRGRGVYGEAARLWEDIDKLYYAQEIALAEEFLTNERAGSHTRDTLEEFRDRYREIQGARANEKAGVNKAYDLFQEDKPLPTDSNERALAEHFRIYDKAMKATGAIDWDIVDALNAYYDKQWTPEQKRYVERNTGLADHPPLIEEYRQVIKKLKPYWETDLDKRMAFRKANPEIDAVLVRWYGYKSQTGKAPLQWKPSPGASKLLEGF